MSVKPENQPYWGQIVADHKKKPLRELSKQYKLSVAELQKALERAGLVPGATSGTPAAAPAAPAAPAPKPEAKPKAKAKAKAKETAAPAATPRRGGAAMKLESVRAELGVVADGVLAERLGVARKTVVEFRKKHGIAPYVPPVARGAAAAEGSAPAAKPPRARKAAEPAAPKAKAKAAAPAPAAGGTGRYSKLDDYRDIIGVLPDREVAERAGMTTENVRMYRSRRGIGAGWRDQAAAAAPAAAKAKAAASAAPKAKAAAPAAAAPAAAPEPAPSAAARRRGRQPAAPGESKVEKALAPFRAEIGATPDAEVAAKAGVSRSAVSAFRQKYAIKASGKGGRPAKARVEEASLPVVKEAKAPKSKPPAETKPAKAEKVEAKAAKVEVKAEKVEAKAAKVEVKAEKAEAKAEKAEAKAEKAEAKAEKAEAKAEKAEAKAEKGEKVERLGYVFRVTVVRDDEKRVFGLIAPDPVEAARRAYEYVSRKGRWTLRDIRLVAEALPD